MSTTPDPVIAAQNPDRLYFSTGELLSADDFRDEQTYHRRQLARALLYLHGSGVIAGLTATVVHKTGQNGAPDEVELRVQPGLALDHVGRLIEVPRDACLRLRRWYTYIAAQPPSSTEDDAGDLREAWRADASVAAGGAVVADLFLSFHECPRNYTPAFASGPFAALDASQPARVRDGYDLELVIRKEPDANLPVASNPWSVIAGGTPAERLANARQTALDFWNKPTQAPPENPATVDATALLLARLRLPAHQAANATASPDPDWSAAAWPDAKMNLNNDVRYVLLPAGALARVFAP
jgi:hypothetical protein